MKKYIKITNKKTIHRLFLEIIGLGTKRKEDDSKVGQWASGFKLATPAALRLGIEVVATSTDIIGPFVLQFDTQDIEVVHEGKNIQDKIIVYKYSDGRITHAPVALGAFRNWSHAIGDDSNPLYPILREYIANARDEDKNFIWEADIANVAQAESGMSAVYIQETPEALDVLSKNHDRYFKFFGATPSFRVIAIGAIYPKSSPKETRRFNDGYLVDCNTDDNFCTSLFDYDAYGKDIVNELRTIKSEDVFYRRLAKLFTRIKDKDLLRQLIEFSCANPSSVEREIFSRIEEKEMSDNFKQMCREIFEEGDRSGALLVCGTESFDSYMRALGHKVLSFGYQINLLFIKAGIKTSKMMYEELFANYGFRALTPAERARLRDVIIRNLWRIKGYRELIKVCPIGAMNDPVSRFRGLCADNYAKVYLAENIFSDEDLYFLGTLCHELDHYETKRPDTDYIELMRHKDHRNARNLILLSIALDALENMGVDISTLCDDFISTKKSP